MTTNELCALPVDESAPMSRPVSLEQCSRIEDALRVMHAWSYAYRTNLTWDKLTVGVGTYWRMCHEHLLLGVRPNTPGHFDDNTISSIIREKRRRHSEEAERCTSPLIERATAGPNLELFGRAAVKGWTVCGNQLAPPDMAAD